MRACDGVGDVRPPRPPALVPLDDAPAGGRPAEGGSCTEYLYRVPGHCGRRFLDVKGYVELTGVLCVPEQKDDADIARHEWTLGDSGSGG